MPGFSTHNVSGYWRLVRAKYLYVFLLHAFSELANLWHKRTSLPPRPRVLHVAPEYFSDESHIGGGARYPWELARAMGSYTPTTMVSFGNRRRSGRYGKTTIKLFRARPGSAEAGDPIGFGFLTQLLRADVVHCYQFNYRVSAVTVLVGALLRKPIFVSDLGGGTSTLSRDLRLSRLVSLFLDLSSFARDRLAHGCPSALIYGGVDTTRFYPGPAPVARKHCLYVGRLLPHKGIDVLIEAAGEDIPVIVVGRPYDACYYADLRRMGEHKQVQFLTEVDDKELVELYRAAFAVVLPSVYTDKYGGYHPNSEYLGLTLLEGMACGAPAVCTRVGGMPEIVLDNVTGFIVPPNDGQLLRARLLRLRDEPELVERLGKAALVRVRQEYTWQRVAERCLVAYKGFSA